MAYPGRFLSSLKTFYYARPQGTSPWLREYNHNQNSSLTNSVCLL